MLRSYGTWSIVSHTHSTTGCSRGSLPREPRLFTHSSTSSRDSCCTERKAMPDKDDSATARYSRFITDLREAAFKGPGQVDPATRQSAATGEALSEPWLSYTKKVR